jgi:hypothetical protein
MQHAPITTPITDKLASMTWIRWFRQLVDRVDEIKGTADAPAWDSITGKPDEFPPETHTHSQYIETETDPTVPAHVKAIEPADIARWDDAVTDEELQALADRIVEISGDAAGSGTTDIPVTVTGIRGQTVPTPVTGFLRWTGSSWAFVEGTLPESMALGDLSDVSLSTPSGSDTLLFVGGEWVNTPSVKIFTQATPAATWGPFAHPYGRPVSVETIDSLGNEFDAGVVQNHPDYTTVTVTLGAATTGRVIIH